MDGGAQPLLTGGKGVLIAKMDASVFERAAWSVLTTTAVVLAYLALSFVLPNQVPFMTEASHIATLHSVVFVVSGVLLAVTLRYVTGAVADQLEFTPVTPLLAALPFVCITLTNAILLPVLGVEAWLRDELGDRFSVLSIIQMLACAEAAAVTLVALLTVFRVCKFRSMYPLGATVSIRAGVSSKGHSGKDASSEYLLGSTTTRYSADGTPHTVSFAAALANVSSIVDESSSAGPTAPIAVVQHGVNSERRASSALGAAASSSSVNSDPPSHSGAAAAAAAAKQRGTSFTDAALSTSYASMASPPPAVAAALSPGVSIPASALGTPIAAVPLPGAPSSAYAAPHELQRLRERCTFLQQRELELSSRVEQLMRQLEADGSSSSSQRDMTVLMRSTSEELAAMHNAHRALMRKNDALEDKIAWYESELRRASTDMKALRKFTNDQRAKIDRLQAQTIADAETNEQAQSVIEDLRQRLASSQAQLAAALAGGGGSMSTPSEAMGGTSLAGSLSVGAGGRSLASAGLARRPSDMPTMRASFGGSLASTSAIAVARPVGMLRAGSSRVLSASLTGPQLSSSLPAVQSPLGSPRGPSHAPSHLGLD